jgi:DNA recombination protein RmuC
MTELLYILAGLLAGALIVFLIKRSSPASEDVSQNINTELRTLREELQRTNNDQRREMQDQLQRVEDQLGKGMRHSHDSMQKQFQQTSKIVQDVTQRLTELDKTNKQVLDFSTQLQDLQNILKNPKQRGVLGEYWLETLLSNVMPTKQMYQMQYHVGEDEKNGQKLIADAVIFVDEQIIPIDAKFTLENYNRMMQETDSERRKKIESSFKADVKKRIDETAKYIRPEFNTTNFAFMFIPAEGVYYNLLNAEIGSGINSNNLVEYAFGKNVMLVSPTSFYAYLQTVLMGLRKLEIEKSTQDIIKRVGELGKHFASYKDVHERLGKNLSTVVNQYNQTSGELKKVSRDVIRITDGSRDEIIELDEITKPSAE